LGLHHLFFFGPDPLEISGGPTLAKRFVDPLSVASDALRELFTHVESTEYSSDTVDASNRSRHLAISGQLGNRNSPSASSTGPSTARKPDDARYDIRRFQRTLPI